ncbi:MAG: heme exporter protein CcmD [Dinoroseobacter sp.]|nr:heme exporter protein CcmD [Dinoroseobacter sp.]MDJ0992823.1 heme exporter protein CcmD [Dinoroseobacter sp.]
MPDLGKYAVEVLSAYGVSLAFLVLLVAWTLYQGAKAKEALRSYEERRAQDGRASSKEAAE